jgi:hypothetical protein
MKTKYTLAMLLFLGAAGIQGCSSTRTTTSTPASGDDVYYNPGDGPATTTTTTTTTQKKYARDNDDRSRSDTDNYRNKRGNSYYQSGGSSSGGTTIINNNYYSDDDYPYTSRLNRFYNPSVSFGYYDPFYSPTYWTPGFHMPIITHTEPIILIPITLRTTTGRLIMGKDTITTTITTDIIQPLVQVIMARASVQAATG